MGMQYESGAGFGFVLEMNGLSPEEEKKIITALEPPLGVSAEPDMDLFEFINNYLYNQGDSTPSLDVSLEGDMWGEDYSIAVFVPGSRVEYHETPTSEELQAAETASKVTPALTSFAEKLRESGVDIPEPAIARYDTVV